MLDLVEGDHIFFRNGHIGKVTYVSTKGRPSIYVDRAILNGWNDVLYYTSEIILDIDGHQYKDKPSPWDIDSRAIYKSRFFLDSVWTSQPIRK